MVLDRQSKVEAEDQQKSSVVEVCLFVCATGINDLLVA